MRTINTQEHGRKSLPAGIWMLGVVSLFMDLSSEMIHGLLPVFLVGTLGVSALTLGLIEGVAEATASIAKLFSGTLSDRFGKRKPLMLLGYGLAALTKPLFPLAGSAGTVFAARTYGAEPDIAAWANGCALNPARIQPSQRNDPAVQTAASRVADHAELGLARLAELAGEPR